MATKEKVKKYLLTEEKEKVNNMAKKMNAYMTLVNKARKSGAKSFKYKGATYKAKKTKTGMLVYKKA